MERMQDTVLFYCAFPLSSIPLVAEVSRPAVVRRLDARRSLQWCTTTTAHFRRCG